MRLIDLDEFLRQNCVDRMDGKTCDECKHHVLEVSCERLMEQPTAEVTLCHLDSPCEYQNADIAMPSAQPELLTDDALKDVSEHYTDKGREWHPHVDFMMEAIQDLPSAQQWISVAERLPSEGENVLLCNILFGNVAIGKLIRYNTSCCWEVDHWDCDIEDWQAWMPLPEPWRGEEDGCNTGI